MPVSFGIVPSAKHSTIEEPIFVNRPYSWAMAEGDIAGHSRFSLSGYNTNVGVNPETVWDYGGIYTYLSSAAAMYISSTDAGDTQTYTVTGLDSDWAEQSVSVTATGTSQARVGTTETFIRVFSVANTGATDNAGDVYIAESDTLTGGVPDTATKIKAMIPAGNNYSNSGLYTVPAGYTAYLIDGYVTNSALKSTTTFLKIRYFGGVFYHTRPIQIYTAAFAFSTSFPAPVPAKSDIEFSAYSTVAGGIVSAGLLGWIE